MLIRIEDLPKGQKIHHITVDITFEDGKPVVETTIKRPDAPRPLNILPPPPPPPRLPPGREITEGGVLIPVDILKGRKKKEIPEEMKDSTF